MNTVMRLHTALFAHVTTIFNGKKCQRESEEDNELVSEPDPRKIEGLVPRLTTNSIMAEPTSSSTSSRIWSIEDILRREPEEPSKSAVLQSRTNYGPLKVQQLRPRSMKSVSGSRFPQPLTLPLRR